MQKRLIKEPAVMIVSEHLQVAEIKQERYVVFSVQQFTFSSPVSSGGRDPDILSVCVTAENIICVLRLCWQDSGTNGQTSQGHITDFVPKT